MEQIIKIIFYAFSKYFWVFAIFITLIPVATAKRASNHYIQKKPELAPGYSKLFCGYLIWMNIPWVVMGIGCTVGQVPSIWYFFNPRDSNPYVLAWFSSIFIMMIVITYWIFFKGGAEFLIKHHNVLSIDISNPKVIRFFWLLLLVAGVFIMLTMWVVDFPIPQLLLQNILQSRPILCIAL
ncbi:MAG: hypothetical protein FVQ85_06410 [Planctomycetes bacterium]|nr:hypothetical protein [Planctomycetota bacterium]